MTTPSKRPRARRTADIVNLHPAEATAAALHDLAAAVRAHTEQSAKAYEFIGSLGPRLDVGCGFFRKWAPRLLYSAPLVAMAVGTITPEMAERLGRVLKTLGLG